MGIADLSSSRSKLVRADEHLWTIHDEFLAFRQQKDAQTLRITYGRDGPWIVVYGGPVPEVSKRVPLVAGDCLNNIRSALDHLVWQLVLREDKEPQQSNCFPICSTREEFIDKVELPTKRGKRNPLMGLPVNGDAWTIIEWAQPFHSRRPESHTLALLALLTNVDKHRTRLEQRILIEGVADNFGWRYGFKPIEQRFPLYAMSAKKPTEVARFRFAPTMAPDIEPRACMYVKRNVTLQPTLGNSKAQVSIQFPSGAWLAATEIVDKIAALPRVQEAPPELRILTQKRNKRWWQRLLSALSKRRAQPTVGGERKQNVRVSNC